MYLGNVINTNPTNTMNLASIQIGTKGHSQATGKFEVTGIKVKAFATGQPEIEYTIRFANLEIKMDHLELNKNLITGDILIPMGQF